MCAMGQQSWLGTGRGCAHRAGATATGKVPSNQKWPLAKTLTMETLPILKAHLTRLTLTGQLEGTPVLLCTTKKHVTPTTMYPICISVLGSLLDSQFLEG